MEGSVVVWAIGIVAAMVFVLALGAFAYWYSHRPHIPRTDDPDASLLRRVARRSLNWFRRRIIGVTASHENPPPAAQNPAADFIKSLPRDYWTLGEIGLATSSDDDDDDDEHTTAAAASPAGPPDHASLLGRVGRRLVNCFGRRNVSGDQEGPSSAAYRQIPSASPDRENAASTGSGHDDENWF